jgi:hypothetical protein
MVTSERLSFVPVPGMRPRGASTRRRGPPTRPEDSVAGRVRSGGSSPRSPGHPCYLRTRVVSVSKYEATISIEEVLS